VQKIPMMTPNIVIIEVYGIPVQSEIILNYYPTNKHMNKNRTTSSSVVSCSCSSCPPSCPGP